MSETKVPAWECPKCGRTHPITVKECCPPSDVWQPRTPGDDWTPPTIPAVPFTPYIRPSVRFGNDQSCLHESCPGCKNGTCSGIHMISCPCPKCSPTCLAT